MKKRLLSFVIVCSLLLALFPCNAAHAYGNSSYSSRTPKAYAFLRDYAKRNGTYHETLESYTMRVSLQRGTWYELIFDAGDDYVAMVICQYTNSQDEYHKLGTLELPYEYWNYEDGWIDMTTIVGGYYMTEGDDADGSAIGDYAVLPSKFSGSEGFTFNKGYDGRAESKQNHEKDAALFVNDILTLLDAILRKGGYTVQDLGFVSYNGHTTHRYWACHESLAPTCEQTGYEKDICYICGARLDQTVPALGHAWKLTETVSEGTDDEHGTGKYACSRCGREKTAPLCALEVFTDAPAEGSWAHNAVDWAFFHGVTTGTSDTKFSPEKGCTRGQVVTFLWRAAGEPEPEEPNAGFTDLKPGAFYEKAVAWAVENEITKGTSADKFSPDATCIRGQIVTFLWRFKGSPAPKSTETPFEDLKPGAYYGDSVAWAVENNVTNGMSDISFAPDNTCTRAQVVTFLYRAMHLPEPVEPEPALTDINAMLLRGPSKGGNDTLPKQTVIISSTKELQDYLESVYEMELFEAIAPDKYTDAYFVNNVLLLTPVKVCGSSPGFSIKSVTENENTIKVKLTKPGQPESPDMCAWEVLIEAAKTMPDREVVIDIETEDLT